MIDLTVLAIVMMLPVMGLDEETWDYEWTLTLYEDHELYLYLENCKPQTAGCTAMDGRKQVWILQSQMNAVPMWGGNTILNHEYQHARGLDHRQIAEQYPNDQLEDYYDRYVPQDKSPKLTYSIQMHKEMAGR